MAMIDKLAIRGIRSFSPDREQSIEFYSPLTMIVGANGCGKTTIIECLKYGTTGQAPPGSASGKAFVHDPKVSGVTEVKANIKIRFRAKTGKDMVVVRSMQLKQTKSTTQFKQMDGVIRTLNEDKTKESLTHKCGELDKAVPMFIGVTAAVLNSVIFCHQEESSWPLQEGAVLKKKFDEIFDSARYSKALDVLKKQKAELHSRSRELIGDLKGLQSDKVAAEGFKRKLEAAQQRIDTCDTEIKEVDEDKAKVDAELAELVAEFEKVAKVEKSLSEASRQCEMLEAKMESMVENLGEGGFYEEKTDDELGAMQIECEEADEATALEERKLNNEMEQFEYVKTDCRDSLSHVDQQRGEVSHERKAAADDQKALVALLKDEEDSAKVEAELKAAEDSAKNEEKAASQSADATSEETARVVSEATRALEEASASTARLTQGRDDSLKTTKDLTEELSKLRTVTEDRAKTATANASRVEAQLDEFRRDARNKEDDAGAVRQLESEERRLADLIQDEELALTNLEANESQMEELLVLEHARKTAESNLREKCAEGASDRLAALRSSIIGDATVEPPADLEKTRAFAEGCKKDLNKALVDLKTNERTTSDEDATARAELRGATADLETTRKSLESSASAFRRASSPRVELAEVTSRLEEIATETMASLEEEDELEVKESLVRPSLPNDGLTDEAYLKEASDIVATLRGWLNKLKAASREELVAGNTQQGLSKQLLSKMSKQKCVRCPLCTRDFSKDEDEEGKVEALRKKLESWGGDSTAAQKRLDELKVQESALDAVESKWRVWHSALTRLTEVKETEEPQAAELLKQTTGRAKETAEALENAHLLATEAREAISLAEELVSLGEDLDEKSAASTEKKEELERLSETMSMMSSGGSGGASLRSTKEVVKKIQELQAEKNEKLNEKMAVEMAKSKALQEENLYVVRLAELRRAAEQASADLAQKQDREKRRTEAQASLRQLEQELRTLKTTDAERRTNLAEAKRERDEKLREISTDRESKRAQSQAATRQLESLRSAIKRSEEGKRRAEEAERRSAELDAKTQTAKEKESEALSGLERCNKAMQKAKSGKSERELLKRRVEGNLTYRVTDRDLAVKRKKRDDFKAQVKKARTTNATGSPSDRRRTLADRDRELARKRGELQGQRSANLTVVKENRTDLRQARYKEVEEQHRSKMIKQQTTSMAASDLELYWASLDKALQNFHSLKIGEINAIVRELWSLTYMGEDIDSIEIVSGQEAGSNKAARSYNYHVQMRKGEAALDMKGRCSAGQRVLASIVIRLALAETFGLHCGILALDEPTTNLDDANRRSLASGLSRIIANRSKQQNFQLVVITHDEPFISSMRDELSSLREFSMPEYYFKISRENVNGRHYSRIDKLSMDTLM